MTTAIMLIGYSKEQAVRLKLDTPEDCQPYLAKESVVSNRMNEVNNQMNENICFSTMFSSIFMALTFIAGIYGMNFEVMPELTWSWGYPFVWLLMLGVAGSLLFYFRRNGWL